MSTVTKQKGAPTAFLSQLHCSYCGFRFDLGASSAEAIEYGVLACACYEYPVVEGIPILRQLEGLERVVGLVKRAARPEALLRALDLFRVQWARKSKVHRLQYYWDCRRIVSNSGASFHEAAQRLRAPRVFADYLIHRYANPSFLAAIGPLMLFEGLADRQTPGRPEGKNGVRVLDLACGAGHASFVMKLLHPNLTVISADHDFVNLYLARRYMAADGLQLCVDAEVPSPLPDQYCDAVYCQDAFHYFKSKQAVVKELKRISTPEALWVFPHLHNRLCQNLTPGLPLTAEKYMECFDIAGGRLFPESELLRELVQERKMDLTAAIPPSQLNGSPTLTFIRGDAATWRVFRDFPSVFRQSKSSLRVNPIYRARRQDNGCLLELHWPNPVMGIECVEAETVLPQTCHLSAAKLAELRGEGSAPDQEWLEDLIAKFVLVPLPRGYTLEHSVAA